MFRMIMSPPYSGSKCVDSDYTQKLQGGIGRETEEERAKEWKQSGAMGRH
jgi:hypothetical protein